MTYEEQTIAEAVKAFRNHDTIYTTGINGIDVLDFRKPDSFIYAIRIVFDHQRGQCVYITGDLGEAVVYPTCLATLFDMAGTFASRKEDGTIGVNWGYFLEKVRATSDSFEWDTDRFWEDFQEHCKEYDLDGDDFVEEHKDSYWDGYVEVDDKRGVTLSEFAKEELHRIDVDFAGWVYDCGKRVSPRVILWLVALRLAYEAVCEEMKEGCR